MPDGGHKAVRLGERCASRAACQSCAQLTWHSRYAGTPSRPLCTSGLERSGVGPVGTPDRSSPEVHRRSAVVPRPRGRSILGSADLTVEFYMVLIRCGMAAAGKGAH